ncbi:MAG: anti-sigma factor family protein, partial [Thermodesulfobacteriota bacterium]
MKCQDVENQLLDYLDGGLDSRSRQAMEKHLDTCAQCRQK